MLPTHQIKNLHAVALACTLVCVAVPAGSQTLGDVARQEAERRKGVKSDGKVLTNKDVPRAPGAAAPAAPPDKGAAAAPDAKPADGATAAPAKPAAGKDDAATKDGASKGTPAKESAKDQQYWSGRLKSLREQVDRDQAYADAMQSRINALTTDFVNRDDPAQRTLIANDRQKSVAELDRLKKSVVDGKKAIADFEEEARRAGVPAGWLR
jgi:hypothetical protein